jgi:predicted dehydrogenase
MVQSARRSNRIVQHGTQQRSAAHFERIRNLIQSGELGPVRYIRIWNFMNLYPRGIGRKPDSEPPPGVDWDFYLGPAPKVPFNANRFVGTYRWFFDYAGGLITDFGTHRIDSMHQVMNVDAPLTVSASGRRFELEDGGDVPDVMQVTVDYPGFVLSYEACALNAHGVGGRTPGRNYYRAQGKEDRPNGLAFYGTNGALFADRIGFEIYPDIEPREDRRSGGTGSSTFRMQRQEGAEPDATEKHAANFIDSVRTRKRPAADIEVGHRSSIVCHLGNIAYRTGRKLRWDASKEEIIDDSEANRLLKREARKPWDMI